MFFSFFRLFNFSACQLVIASIIISFHRVWCDKGVYFKFSTVSLEIRLITPLYLRFLINWFVEIKRTYFQNDCLSSPDFKSWLRHTDSKTIEQSNMSEQALRYHIK